MTRAWLLAPALLATALAGCIATPQSLEPASLTPGAIPADVVWDTAGNMSRTLEKGVHKVLPVERLDLDTSLGTSIASAVWRPEVPEGTKVPVILTVSPYWGAALEEPGESGWTKEFWLDNFVAHGYAYGRVAVRGTSFSSGCMEFMSMGEQQDIDEAITFYGSQPWSNGNVALVGVSYDGTTPWMAASFGNPHLKAIVPISGLTDVAGLMYRNGTAEGRGTFMSLLYTLSTGMPERSGTDWSANACEEALRGALVHPYTAMTGDRANPFDAAYWDVRDWRERVRENYEGSVYLVHGLQDWNVEATMAFPYVTQLQQDGWPTKMMLGQWGHSIPDGYRDQHLRWDWAETLMRWFDQELKGEPRTQGASVDVEDNHGLWRTEETWPPADAALTTWYLGPGTLEPEPTEEGSILLGNPAGVFDLGRMGGFYNGGSGPVGPAAWFELPRLAEDLRFAGLAQLHVTVVPHSPEGGRVYAELLDLGRGGAMTRVAHGVMDLRYHAGGAERHQLTPGEPVVAQLELFPADVLIPAGHRLVLRIVPDNGNLHDGTAPSPTPLPIEVRWGGEQSVLRLPIIERDVGDGRYPGQPVAG